MSFLVYFFVLLVAASSVLFGLDWMQAPLQPPGYPERAALSAPAHPQTPVRKVADTSASATPVAKTAVQVGPVPAAQAPAPVAQVADVPATTGTATGSAAVDAIDTLKGADPSKGVNAQTEAQQKPPLCDIAACERAYHTFTPADCTYKPYEGPRRLCTKGNPPGRRAALFAANESRAQARCNVSACESAYSSFDAATCTYQPYDGVRRLCTK